MKKSLFFLLSTLAIVAVGIIINACQKETKQNSQLDTPPNGYVEGTANHFPYPNEKIPEATVELKKFDYRKVGDSRESCSSLIPELIEATLAAGESINENKVGTICNTIEKGDVIFMFDLTGSMRDELLNVQNNSQNIMGAIRSVMGEADFGVVSHMDYNGVYTGCGYEGHYGSGIDYPYQLDQAITSEINDVSNAMNNLSSLGFGWDYPECYARVLYELTAPDAGIGWRMGSKKIVIAWLDNQPHDCSLGTGPDPGRDAIANNEDDLNIEAALQGLVNNNIILYVLYSGKTNPLENYLPLWKGYCTQTGGEAFQINSDGTIPGDVDIDEFIAQIIQENVSPIEEVSLQVCTPGFENWLTNVSPENYTNVEFTESISLPFDIEITVPEGTQYGVYEFDICLIGDGIEFGRQHVVITVVDGIFEVPFDIHPTSCPNPINRKSGGVMPAAIVGFEGFDVRNINVQSLNIQGVQPIRSSVDDVVTPYFPFIGKRMNKMSCTTDGPDGYDDLTLKFNSKEISNLLNGYKRDDLVILTINGELMDGTQLIGEDIIIIVK